MLGLCQRYNLRTDPRRTNQTPKDHRELENWTRSSEASLLLFSISTEEWFTSAWTNIILIRQLFRALMDLLVLADYKVLSDPHDLFQGILLQKILDFWWQLLQVIPSKASHTPAVPAPQPEPLRLMVAIVLQAEAAPGVRHRSSVLMWHQHRLQVSLAPERRVNAKV